MWRPRSHTRWPFPRDAADSVDGLTAGAVPTLVLGSQGGAAAGGKHQVLAPLSAGGWCLPGWCLRSPLHCPDFLFVLRRGGPWDAISGVCSPRSQFLTQTCCHLLSSPHDPGGMGAYIYGPFA